MPKGGKRPGSGRPKGALTTRTREIAEKAFAAGITPLEMMLKAMTVHHDNGDWDKAATIAKDAAPYVHPRLAAVEHSSEVPLGEIVFNVTRAKADD